MRHIFPYVDNSLSLQLESNNSNRFKLLNDIESVVPELESNRFHLELFQSRDHNKIIEYNKGYLNGSSDLLNEIDSLFPKAEILKLKSKVKSLMDKLEESIINEQGAIPTDASALDIKDWDNVMGNIESTTDIPSLGSKEKLGVFGFLKKLWLALTEDGSAIGILHFVLDILGLVGDGIMMATGIPVGIAADLINGVIYAYRAVNGDKSKYILAIISLVAAVIPLYGDVFKGITKGTKSGSQMMQIGTTYFSKEAVKTASSTGAKVIPDAVKSGKISIDAVQLAKEASPEAIKALNYTAGATKKAIPLLRDLIAKFFDGFLSMVTGWLPIIGKPLKKFFNSIGTLIRGFSKSASKFANDIPKIIKAADLAKIDSFFKTAAKSNSKIVVEGGDLVVKSGGIIEKIPAHLLTAKDILSKRFGGPLTRDMAALLKSSDMNIAAFYKSMAENLKYFDSKVYSKVVRIGRVVIASKRTWTLFLGKQIYKFITGFDPLKMGVSESELEAIGISSFQKMAKEIQKQEMEKDHKIKYPIPILDSDNPDHAKIWNGAQQSYAEMMGLPSIESAVYYKNKEKDKWPEGLKEFMELSLKKQMPAIKKMEKLEKDMGLGSYIKEGKHIISYSTFLNRNI